MPRSFLVRTRPIMEQPCGTSNDTSDLHYASSGEKRNFHGYPLDKKQQLTLEQTNNHQTNKDYDIEDEVTKFNNAYKAIPCNHATTIASPIQSSMDLRSQHDHTPRDYTWSPVSWLPTDGRLFFYSDQVSFRSPIVSRCQTWAGPDFGKYPVYSQPDQSTGEEYAGVQTRGAVSPAPVSTNKYVLVDSRGSQSSSDVKNASMNEKQLQRNREVLKPVYVFEEFFATEEVARSKQSKEEKMDMEERKHFNNSAYQHSNQELVTVVLKEGKQTKSQLQNVAARRESESRKFLEEADHEENNKTNRRNIPSNAQKKECASSKLHICNECGKSFRLPGNLTRHKATHNLEKSHVCSTCNKTFSRASNLQAHIKTHSDYKPYKCDYCGKGFHQKVDKRVHHYTHTGEKPHKCQKCGRAFKQLTHLNYHMRTHSDTHMYHCTYCGKGFNQKGNLQAHIYGHTGERPFSCGVCGKGFTLRSTLNTHLRTHATKKPFDCEYCGKAFYQKNALKMHYIASHPMVNGKSIL